MSPIPFLVMFFALFRTSLSIKAQDNVPKYSVLPGETVCFGCEEKFLQKIRSEDVEKISWEKASPPPYIFEPTGTVLGHRYYFNQTLQLYYVQPKDEGVYWLRLIHEGPKKDVILTFSLVVLNCNEPKVRDSVCNGHGHCEVNKKVDPVLAKSECICDKGYTGHRCQEAIRQIRELVVVAPVLGICLFVFIVSVIYIMFKNKKAGKAPVEPTKTCKDISMKTSELSIGRERKFRRQQKIH